MNKRRTAYLFLLALICFVSSCGVYKQDILFTLDEKTELTAIEDALRSAEGNYEIRKDDWLKVEVFTNAGERLIDPNFELQQGMIANQQGQMRRDYLYLVQKNGEVKLPIAGKMNLAKLTIDQAEKMLEEAYDEYYVGSFVKLTLTNRRVVVLGGSGGQVIPIENENTSLLEVLALYGGIDRNSKGQNIRLLRGSLENPEVFLIDLSTIDGMKSSIIQVNPGDIIYIEPWRRPFFESFKDISPVLSLTVSVLTLIVVIQNL